MNGDYAEYIETEVLPRVEKNCGVKLTKDPDGRAAMGNSSGGSAALIMAWFRNDLYHRVLTTSGTFVNQAWPFDPKYPDGAWGFHETLIPNSPKKPIRLFISVGDADLLNPNVMRDGMHDWVEANHRMAKVLKAKGYEYQYLFCRGARPQRRQRPAAVPPARHRVGVEGVCPEDGQVVDRSDVGRCSLSPNVESAFGRHDRNKSTANRPVARKQVPGGRRDGHPAVRTRAGSIARFPIASRVLDVTSGGRSIPSRALARQGLARWRAISHRGQLSSSRSTTSPETDGVAAPGPPRSGRSAGC